ncbi:hypothetical protein GKS94_22715 [Salmonella enterica subsp. enterica]|nr:hypothetical protein [Salmonella enterica]EBD8444292.1 hypothetical protein [Salmonella enterica subsp. enterica serovar Liverpool]ECS3571181.1 hypothetical protein [Salmonella enterica subsp. enterica serovar Hadar]EDD9092737.1 hypothetical protein [Salmonella enterica subsp. enterica serovar Schwarzengrund]EDT5154333.1 hypothetical protein [Salmonella enterica subsp. enterica serovar Oranienburg]EEM7327640.1 hypothetical protein [Salmonella enterica subsp. enterica]
MHEQKDKKRRLGFMIGKSNATLPADEQTEAELDQEVLKLFYPNQETQDTIERSEAGTDVFTATDAPDLFKKLKL